MIDILIKDLGKLPDDVDPYDITSAILDPETNVLIFNTKYSSQYQRHKSDAVWRLVPNREGWPADPDAPCKGVWREMVFGVGETDDREATLSQVLRGSPKAWMPQVTNTHARRPTHQGTRYPSETHLR